MGIIEGYHLFYRNRILSRCRHHMGVHGRSHPLDLIRSEGRSSVRRTLDHNHLHLDPCFLKNPFSFARYKGAYPSQVDMPNLIGSAPNEEPAAKNTKTIVPTI